ncbi:MAG: hypothetical protein R2877_00735 [Bdellovibrionota bacterium]
MARITLAGSSARISFFFVMLFSGLAFADPVVTNALVNSDQTYVINDQGESVQEYGVGQLVYVVIDEKKQDKKRKDFYRVTFDPTNLAGDGWVLRDKVKLMTAYRSIDGKEPTEYERKAAPLPSERRGSSAVASSESSSTEASSFLEELIKKDEQKAEYKPIKEQAPAKAVEVKPAEKNHLENDLEFLFQEEGAFKNTFKEARAEVRKSMQKKVGVSKFTASSDAFATQVMDQFSTKIQKNSRQSAPLPKIAFSPKSDDGSSVANISIGEDLDGVFFGQMSPKIGQARLRR